MTKKAIEKANYVNISKKKRKELAKANCKIRTYYKSGGLAFTSPIDKGRAAQLVRLGCGSSLFFDEFIFKAIDYL